MIHRELGPCPCGAIHFTCPSCGARHARGWVNGVDTFRCLKCGYQGHGFHPDAEIDFIVGVELRKSVALDRSLGLQADFWDGP